MASVSKEVQKTKDGQRYWRISVSRGYGKTPYTTRFYWPNKANGSPVSETDALKKLNKAVSEFEAKCKSGQILSREEQKAKEAEEALEAAKIKTLRQYGEQVFIPNKIKVHKVAEKTRRYYQNVLDNHLYPALGDMPLPEITVSMLKAFFLSDEITSLSHSSQNGIYVTANQLFEMAYKEDVIPINPLDKVDRPRESKDKVAAAPPRFTLEELDIIKESLKADALKNDSNKWLAFVSILIHTGMRRGEVCALTWDKIVYSEGDNKGYIIVNKNIGYTPEKGVFVANPKTKSGIRNIPMTKELESILKDYRAEQIAAVEKRKKRLEQEHKVLSFENLGEYAKKVEIPDYLFTIKGTSDPIFPDSVNRFLQRFSKEYGIEDCHAHKFRHTFASILDEKGTPAVIISYLLGHADVNTAYKVYVHPSKEGINNYMDKFESVISKTA